MTEREDPDGLDERAGGEAPEGAGQADRGEAPGAGPGITRRAVLGGALAAGAGWLAGCQRSSGGRRTTLERFRRLPGTLSGTSSERGHRIRSGALRALKRPAVEQRRTDVLIVGAGAAGLSAAWRLARSGMTNYAVIELEDVVGGTARSDANSTSAFPWGAHYLPTPPREAGALRTMLEEFGVITGHDESGEPIYRPSMLCAAPVERLHEAGFWTKGLWPSARADARDQAQFRRFRELCEQWSARRGADGRPGFTLPTAYGSSDPVFVELDRLSAREWLDQEQLHSERLRWYVEYGARDDYGGTIENVSAWAMVHYHMARDRQAHEAILTWPEGNGYLIRRLAQRSAGRLHCGQLAAEVRLSGAPEAGADRVVAKVWDANRDRLIEWRARELIFAAPKFLIPYVFPDLRDRAAALSRFTWSAWLVAAITLRKPPGGAGEPLAWDNVFFESPSLGYVVANRPGIGEAPERPTVVTWYLPFVGDDTAAARQELLTRSREHWLGVLGEDLAAVHPTLIDDIERVDLFRWGHAMIRPTPGFHFGAERRAALEPAPGLHFAGTDTSSMALFEEAHDSGVRAAEACLRALGRPFKTLL